MNAVLVAALWVTASVVLAAGVASFIRAAARRDVAEEAEDYLRALAHGRPRGSLVGVRVATVVVVLGALVTVSYRTVGDLPRRLITAASAHADLIGGGNRTEPTTERASVATTTGKHRSAARGRAATPTTPTTTRPGDAGAAGGDGTEPVDSTTADPAVSATTTTTLVVDATDPPDAPSPGRGTTTTTAPPDDTGGFASPSRTTTTTTTSTTTPPETTTTTTTPPETTTTTAPPPETTTTTAPPAEPGTAG